MNDLVTRDVPYTDGETDMVGYVCAPAGARSLPAVLLIHDAFGLSDDMMQIAHQLGALGFPVFAADVWGQRLRPSVETEIGPLIGAMVTDRPTWMRRIAAAHAAAAAQPEIHAGAVVALGYCFGGSSALEYVRTGGSSRSISAVISIHGGLDLLETDWASCTATPRVLICTGADDPMATTQMRAQLESALSGAGIDWEVNLYSDTKHAFTSPKAQFSPMPDMVAYNARSAARAWHAMTALLRDLYPHTPSA